MRIHSFIKVFVAALTIAFAVSMGTVPVSAQVQPPVSVSNVTQVRLTCKAGEESDIWCGIYDKIAPDRWVQRQYAKIAPGGWMERQKEFKFAQNFPNNIGANMISISDASRGITLVFNFGTMLCSGEMKFGGRSRSGYIHITGVYEISADSSPDTCRQEWYAGTKCNCDLGSLRPLQGAVGLAEVTKKKDDIVSETKVSETKARLDLAYDPITLVRGPNYLVGGRSGFLYVTDHHHGARAWMEAGHTMGTCMLQTDRIPDDSTQFWAYLKDKKLERLADENGNPITEAQLPTTLRALPDDPYRTLAWMVRKKDGFCRALMTENKEFAEFQWADWLRKRPELPYSEVKASPANMLATALRLAKSTAAAGLDLPGYRGDRPAKYKCPPNPD
jgi:hypothetical protein